MRETVARERAERGTAAASTRSSGAPPGATYTPAHLDETGRFVPGSEK